MKNTYLAIISLLFFYACQSDSSTKANNDQTSSEITTTPPMEEEAIPTSGERYLHLKGTIGNYPVTMDLQIDPSGTSQGWDYSGTYYYDKVGKPLSLQGYFVKNSPIELEEYDRPGKITGKFVGAINAQNVFEGTWRSGDNSKTLEFKLLPQPGVQFKLLAFSDSLVWEAPGTEGSTAYFDETWLWPSGNLAADRHNFLTQQILMEMAGDSLSNIYHDPQSLYKVQRDWFFNDFATEMKLILENNEGEEPAWLPPGYASSTSMEVTYNTQDLVTLAYLNYSFSGGAHGNYGTTFKVYDLAQQKVLTLNDIFKPGYETTLNQALDQAIRENYEIPADRGLSEVLFEDTIAANDNFGLTAKGIIFNYVPYEISAYAVGEIRLFISFEDLKEVLREEILQ